jgi:hypothetical protein
MGVSIRRDDKRASAEPGAHIVVSLLRAHEIQNVQEAAERQAGLALQRKIGSATKTAQRWLAPRRVSQSKGSPPEQHHLVGIVLVPAEVVQVRDPVLELHIPGVCCVEDAATKLARVVGLLVSTTQAESAGGLVAFAPSAAQRAQGVWLMHNGLPRLTMAAEVLRGGLGCITTAIQFRLVFVVQLF